MARDQREPDTAAGTTRGLVVGNYCHDVLIRDGVVVAESLGGATAFIAAVLDALSIAFHYVSKVGLDFAYPVSHAPTAVLPSPATTTLFHAHFSSDLNAERVLKRIQNCDPITPSDLPPEPLFDFGMAVGVGGEISPLTLERIIDVCDVVLVDIQSIIRGFDPIDGTVRPVDVKESGFFHLLPRIRFLKASAEEATYSDVEEARKLCCVIVTNGKDGCMVYWKDWESQIAPFETIQVDPTGAGDSFLGGFVFGLVQGLAVPDAALLGNFFGSLTVSQIGVPKFDPKLLQRVKEEVQMRKIQYVGSFNASRDDLHFTTVMSHEQFHTSLSAVKQACQPDFQKNATEAAEPCMQQKLLPNSVCKESIQLVDAKP